MTAAGCVSWVAMYPPAGLPKDMVEPTIGGSDYWANKVRMQYRKTNPEQVQVCMYVWSSHIARVWINWARLPILLVVS